MLLTKELIMNKSQVKTKEDLELYYSKVRKIRFNEENLKFNSIKELFDRYVKRDSNDTYYKKGKQHCSSGRNRSIDDFIVIAKHYFSNLTVKEILLEIKDFQNKKVDIGYGTSQYPYLTYCHNIRKNNIFYSNHFPSWINKDPLSCINLKENGFKNCNLTLKAVIE